MNQFIQSIPARLTRVTSGGKLIREIDGLRFVAIVPVLIQHLTERFERNTPVTFNAPIESNYSNFLAHRGFLGVYIFFVISGFVLALPFASHRLRDSHKVNIGTYFWRRLTRLEPPYIIWMTVFFIVFIIQKNQSFLEYLPHYLANITYTHAIIYNTWSPFNPPTWTLEIEVQFYILAPVLAYLFFFIRNKILRRSLNLLLMASLVLTQQYLKLYLNPYSFSILGHLHYFLLGFILADIYLTDWKVIAKNTWYDLLALISLASLLYFWSWNYELISRIAVLISLFLFFIAVFKSNYVNRFITNRWIMSIGGMCYTIYLIHLPFSEFFIRLSKNLTFTQDYTINLIIQLALFIPVTLILSGFFFLLFEKPFMDKGWPQLFSRKISAMFK